MYLRRFEVKVHNQTSRVSLSTCQYSDRPLHIFLPQSTNPIHTLQIHMNMRMLEKIKMRISVAAIVLNAIYRFGWNLEASLLASLQSPLVLVFPPRRKLNYTISKTVEQTRAPGAGGRGRCGQLACPSSPGLFLFFAEHLKPKLHKVKGKVAR